MTKEVVYSKLGLKDLSRVKYEIDRYFSHTPGVIQIDVMMNDNVLQSIKTREELTTMGFATFQSENKSYTYAKSDIKETLVAYGVPFNITDVNLVESSFLSPEGETQYNVEYDIELNTDSPDFTMASRKKDLAIFYRLSLPANNYRRNEMKDLIKPTLAAEKKMPAILAKMGKTYVFKDVDPTE